MAGLDGSRREALEVAPAEPDGALVGGEAAVGVAGGALADGARGLLLGGLLDAGLLEPLAPALGRPLAHLVAALRHLTAARVRGLAGSDAAAEEEATLLGARVGAGLAVTLLAGGDLRVEPVAVVLDGVGVRGDGLLVGVHAALDAGHAAVEVAGLGLERGDLGLGVVDVAREARERPETDAEQQQGHEGQRHLPVAAGLLDHLRHPALARHLVATVLGPGVHELAEAGRADDGVLVAVAVVAQLEGREAIGQALVEARRPDEGVDGHAHALALTVAPATRGEVVEAGVERGAQAGGAEQRVLDELAVLAVEAAAQGLADEAARDAAGVLAGGQGLVDELQQVGALRVVRDVGLEQVVGLLGVGDDPIDHGLTGRLVVDGGGEDQGQQLAHGGSFSSCRGGMRPSRPPRMGAWARDGPFSFAVNTYIYRYLLRKR